MKRTMSRLLPSAGVLAFLMATPGLALAQEASEETSEEIVVTGTSIRGVAPAGAQVIGLDEQEVRATGATSTAQVLATIPQLSDFGDVPTIQTSNNFRLATNRPNLRGLPGGIGGSSPTLILMDGHRLPGSGVQQTFADPDIIPAGALQRVEVVPDGGSAIYGADAVGGVINFITRREFDGLQADGRVGFADNYQSEELSLTGGQAWSAASAFVSYNYVHRDPIYNRDRDYVRNINWLTGEGSSDLCFPGTIVVGANTYPIVDADPIPAGPANFCDGSQDSTLFSEETRQSILAGLSGDLAENLRFDLRAWYTMREVEGDGGALGYTQTVTSNNPYYRPVVGDTGTQSVRTDFTSVRPHNPQTADMQTWGFSPELTWDIGADWQMRAFLNYGHSVTDTRNPSVNNVLLASYINVAPGTGLNDAIDPYDPSNSANLALVDEVLSQVIFGRGEDEIANARAVFDGPLFQLPGGEVRLAVGAEYMWEDFRTQSGDIALGTEPPVRSDYRRAQAVFLEANVPIVGEGNELPLIHSLSLSLAARTDIYSDLDQSPTSPRFGFTYEPVDWLTFRGHWGEAFQAPSLFDTANAVTQFGAFCPIPNAVLMDPVDVTAGMVATDFCLIAIQGSDPNLKPQEATTWSAGFEVRPPFIPNLDFSVSYYNLEYRGRIGSPLSRITTLYADFPNSVYKNPDTALIDFFADQDPLNSPNELAEIDAAGLPIYAILDVRNKNTGNNRVAGLDVSVNYTQDTGFGTLFGSLNGNYEFFNRDSLDASTPYRQSVSGRDGNQRYSLTATLGATVGEHFLGQMTVNYLPSTRLTNPLGTGTADPADDQDSIDSFTVANLYLQYDVLGAGFGEDLTFSLGVNNFTDAEPPEYKGVFSGNFSQAGFANGSTLGRVVSLGVSKRF